MLQAKINEYEDITISGNGICEPFTFAKQDLPPVEDYIREAETLLSRIQVIPLPDPPAPRERKIGKFAYFPCANVAHVYPRATVAGLLAKQGWQCIVADEKSLDRNGYGDFPPGVVMFNAATVSDSKAIFKAQSHGHMTILHDVGVSLSGSRWARKLADSVVKAALGEMPLQRLVMRDMRLFKERLSQLLIETIGEQLNENLKESLFARIRQEHETIDEVDRSFTPIHDGEQFIADQFHKLWVRNQYAMPWFDVMTAWIARKGNTHRTQWSETLHETVIQRASKAKVFLLWENCWAIRA